MSITADVRYYAITLNGRYRLNATLDDAAVEEVERSHYLSHTTKRIVREARVVIFEQEPDGVVG